MPDKKVSRNGQGRPPTPTQRMEAALSDPGTVNVAESSDNKAKATLVDKFRSREERWRREQTLHEQRGEAEHETRNEVAEEAGDFFKEVGRIELGDESEGGASS